MLTVNIKKEDKEILKKLFDEYCNLVYNREYPLTDRNIYNYYLAFIQYYYADMFEHWVHNGAKIDLKKNSLYIRKSDNLKANYCCIINSSVQLKDHLEDFNKELKEKLC